MTRKYLLYLAFAIIVIGLTGVLPVAAAGISDVSPREGTVGTAVTISGSGFGAKAGEVLLGSEKCKVQDWSDTRIVCTVSKPQPTGDYTVTVQAQKGKKAAAPMTFSSFAIREPEIARGELIRDGDTVTIAGAFFGDKKGDVRLAYYDGGLVTSTPRILHWSMNAVRFRLPSGLTGRFALKIKNDLGADYALFDIDNNPPVVGSIPDPVGYGGYHSCANARGIYYNDRMYVFSLWYKDNPSFKERDNQYLIQVRTFKDKQLSGAQTLWGGKSEAEPVPLIVQYPDGGPQKMFVFVTGRNGNIYFTRLNGDVWEDGDWIKIVDVATGGVPTTSENTYEVAPVYDPANHRLYVYYAKDYNDYLHWAYSDDFGNTWHAMGTVQNAPVVRSAPSAVLFNDGSGSVALLAAKDASQKIRLFHMGQGWAIRTEVLATTDDVGGQGRPFLADLGPDGIAAIYGEHQKASGSIYEQYYVPRIRILNPSTGIWGAEYQPMSLPDVFGVGREYQFEWQPNGAINYEPNGSGGYDRVFYLFFGYRLILWSDGEDGPWWEFAAVENMGP